MLYGDPVIQYYAFKKIVLVNIIIVVYLARCSTYFGYINAYYSHT